MKVLKMLHIAHPGIVYTKTGMYGGRALISIKLQMRVKLCVMCQKNRTSPPVGKMYAWALSNKPWPRPC